MIRLLPCVMTVMLLGGCWKSESPGENGSDAGAPGVDTNAGADADSDADTDTDTDTDTDSDTDTDDDTEEPTNLGRHLRAIHGTGVDNIYAVGDCGLLLHFDGDNWQKIDLGVNDNLNTIWAMAPDNVLVGGARHSVEFSECALETPYESKGIIYLFDGAEWQVVFEREKEHSQIESIWGSSPENIYAVGGLHLYSCVGIDHFDGISWSNMSETVFQQICYNYSHNLEDIWGFPNGNIYTIDYHAGADDIWNDLVFFPDSFNMECQTIGLEVAYSELLTSIWGNSRENVFVSTAGGQVHRFDGLSWHKMETGVSTSLLSVWGLGADNVYAVGKEGLVIQYNGETGKQLVTDIPGDLRDVWGTDQAIFAVGDDDTTLPREERSPAIYRIDHDGSVRVY